MGVTRIDLNHNFPNKKKSFTKLKNTYTKLWKTFTKKSHLRKKLASGQFQYTQQICPLLKKVEIMGTQNARFGRPQRPNVIWCGMKFYANHFFSTLCIFYVKMVTSEVGGGLHILSWQTTATCCTMCKRGLVGIGHERFENSGSVLGRHPGIGYTGGRRSPTL